MTEPITHVYDDRIAFFLVLVAMNLTGAVLGWFLPAVGLLLGTLWAGVFGVLLGRNWRPSPYDPPSVYLKLWGLFSSFLTPGCLLGVLLQARFS